MARKEKVWTPKFREYSEKIVSHANYKSIPYTRKKNGEISWIASKKSEIGKERVLWAEEKAKELGYPIQPGVYAKVMLEQHPTKIKPCQICGKELSLYYIYLNPALIKSLLETYNIEFDTVTSLEEAVNTIIEKGFTEESVKQYLIDKFKLENKTEDHLEAILDNCELRCREEGSKLLGPGAMSNFPDRLDGFHTYNRCCRKKEDKGRNSDNMKSYNTDRRAYENWSDGNIYAANKYMKSHFFNGDSVSADHIGPISLGFKHESVFMQPMSTGDNSAKRDRLGKDDIVKLISLEKKHSLSSMSFFSNKIWHWIKNDFISNHEYTLEDYRNLLKQNMHNFFCMLNKILNECGTRGESFLGDNLWKNKYEHFKYNYDFAEDGTITKKSLRRKTDSSSNEYDRILRIAFNSVKDYFEKDNRNLKCSFSSARSMEIKELCSYINSKEYNSDLAFDTFNEIISKMQDDLLNQ